MYNEFFGFREKPFQLIPNPEFFFLGKNHKNALAHLTYAATQGDGFVEITGEVGTGKTTLCRVFLENLDENVDAAFIFNPQLSSIQLLESIHEELGLTCSEKDAMALTRSLNQYLLEEKSKGRSVILLIDEAQHLEKETLEQLRLLSNLETTRSKLLQIVLVGQPELGDLLDSFDLRQLRQRINLSCELAPLTLSETRSYISHRTQVASGTNTAFFTPPAVRSIYKASKGIPRRINMICDRALLTAYAQDRPQVNLKTAKTAIKELNFPPQPDKEKKHSALRLFMRISLMLLTLLAALVITFNDHIDIQLPDFSTPQKAIPRPDVLPPAPVQQTPQSQPANAATAQVQVPDAAENKHLDTKVLQVTAVDSINSGTDRNTAVFYLFSLWKRLPEKDIQSFSLPLASDMDFFHMAAVQNRFLLLQLRYDFELIKKLDLPVILELVSREDRKLSYIILHQITKEGKYLFSNGKFNESFIIERDALVKTLGSRMYMACPNIFGQERLITRGSDRLSILQVKMILRNLGFSDIALDPEYDVAVENAIQQIQTKYGLVQDGIAGPATKIALYKEKNDPLIPLLSTNRPYTIKKALP